MKDLLGNVAIAGPVPLNPSGSRSPVKIIDELNVFALRDVRSRSGTEDVVEGTQANWQCIIGKTDAVLVGPVFPPHTGIPRIGDRPKVRQRSWRGHPRIRPFRRFRHDCFDFFQLVD